MKGYIGNGYEFYVGSSRVYGEHDGMVLVDAADLSVYMLKLWCEVARWLTVGSRR